MDIPSSNSNDLVIVIMDNDLVIVDIPSSNSGYTFLGIIGLSQ